MKAIVVHEFTAFDQAVYEEIADPQPGADEVVVDVEASDVNFPDILYIEGTYQKKPAFPFSPGLGGAGRIAAVGPRVERFSIGQKVVVLPYHGTYAEKVLAPANFCFPMPEIMPYEIGAALTLVYQTAYFALLDRGRFHPGDTVLILGASGGVGMAAVQLAKALGAGKVIAATRGSHGASFARAIGADVVIDSSMADLRDGLRDAIEEATDGHGADIVIDPVGGALSAAALRALAWRGRLVVVGFAGGEIPTIRANYLLVKNIEVSGLQWTDYRQRQPDRVRAAQQQIFDLWQEGTLQPRIARTLALQDYADALTEIRHAQVHGKVILLTH